jgi:HD-GYP domain-containing protein (c-di-GMP phosphodiesterase class II)
VETGPTQGASETRETWARRPVLALGVRLTAMALPAVVAWIVTSRVAGQFWRPAGATGVVVWITELGVVGTVTVILVERLTRRLLPLAALFNLSLVFPDRAPSRFRTALRSGTIRNLQEQLERQRRSGVTDPGEIMATIVELVARLGHHERLTRGHTERVRAYADTIAVEMGLDQSDRYLLQWSCLLHDIGKLSVAPEILNKSGRPTDDEWASLRRHPEVGGEIVEPLAPWLGEWRLAASQHHERWDGGGYPAGLAGTDISLAGRVVAVADAYDVITAARSYKKPMSVASARAELVRCAGGQFDPEVVRAFLNVGLGRTSIAVGPLGWLREVTALGSLGTTSPAGEAVGAARESARSDVAGRPTINVDTGSRAPGTSGATGVAAPIAGTPGGSTGSTGAIGSAGTTTTVIGATTTVPGRTGGLPVTTTTVAHGGGGGSAPTTTAPPGVPTTAPSPTVPPPTTPPPTTPPPTTTAPRTPVANDDSSVAVLGVPVTINVLANDTDADGDLDPATLTIITAPVRGSATISSNKIVYQPAGFYLGQTTLVYRVCDTGGRCDTATVTITSILA